MKHLNEQEKIAAITTISKIEEQLKENKSGLTLFIDGQINAVSNANGISVVHTLLNFIYNENQSAIYALIASTHNIELHIVRQVFHNHCKERLIKELLTQHIQ